MAEVNPSDSVRPSSASPKLVALPEERQGGRRPTRSEPQASEGGPLQEKAASASGSPEHGGVSQRAFRLVVALLVLAFVGLLAQTWRVAGQAEQIGLLIGQVEGLEVQLSAANTQIATYDMQRNVVQVSVSRLFEQMAELNEFVQLDPLTRPPASPPASQ